MESQESKQAGLFSAIFVSMRIGHWIKNGFVLAPLLFSMSFNDPDAWVKALAATFAFGLLSSGVYLINDICDRNRDRAHPVKRDRPIASGSLSVSVAAVFAIVLVVAGMAVSVAVAMPIDQTQPLGGWAVVVWAGGYFVLNLLYSFWLKSHIIIDVIIVALGFVLRAMAGAAAISTPVSPWLVVCTFTLCLFIALTKRRGEILSLLPDQAAEARPVSKAYDMKDIDYMVTVSSAMAILTYCLYCLAPGTVNRIGSAHMVWTIPIVLYGMFRFNRITSQAASQDPAKVLLRDRIMWLVLIGYVVATGLILVYGSSDAVRSILDVDLITA